MHVDEDRPTREQLDASWDETFERLRSFIAARVRDDDVAADIAQDVLVRSIAAGALERVDNPTAWLYRSARNAVIDHYRTRHVHEPLEPADELWPEPEPTDDRPNDATRDLAALPATTRRPAPRDLPRGARPGRPRRAEPPRRRRRGRHLDVGDEVTRPAGPPPAQGAAHRLLRRAGRPTRRRRLLPSQRRRLRLSRWRLNEAQAPCRCGASDADARTPPTTVARNAKRRKATSAAMTPASMMSPTAAQMTCSVVSVRVAWSAGGGGVRSAGPGSGRRRRWS